MPVTLINPEGMFKPETFWQASISEGSRVIHISGQVARDETGATVGVGDLATQTACAYINVAHVLSDLKSSFSDVAKLNVYVVGLSPQKLSEYRRGVERAARQLDVDLEKAATLVGVTALVDPQLLIEIEAVALLS
jgi:enamine deaminase RidA (YjgF/YER057c/UK114 family)